MYKETWQIKYSRDILQSSYIISFSFFYVLHLYACDNYSTYTLVVDICCILTNLTMYACGCYWDWHMRLDLQVKHLMFLMYSKDWRIYNLFGVERFDVLNA